MAFAALVFVCAVLVQASAFPSNGASAQPARALLSIRPPELRGDGRDARKGGVWQMQTRPPDATPTCVRWSGGGCNWSPCGDWRGSTSCVKGKCFCQEGFCAGVDGVCYSQENVLVAPGITLRNARWADQYMHFPGTGSVMKVGNKDGIIGESDVFDLYQLPGTNGSEFLLDSDESPNRIAGAQGAIPQARHMSSFSARRLGVRVFAAPRYEGEPKDTRSVMIAPAGGYERYFLAARAGRWTLGLHKGDPGPRGYWLVDPPDAFDGVELAEFDGEACAEDCGAYGSGTSTIGRVHVAMLVAFNVVFMGGLGVFFLVHFDSGD